MYLIEGRKKWKEERGREGDQGREEGGEADGGSKEEREREE